MFANSHNALNRRVLSSCVSFLTAALRFSWRMFVLNLCGFVYIIWGKRSGSYTLKDIWGNKIAHANTLEVFYLEFLSIVTTEQIYEPQWILVRALCHLTSLQICVFFFFTTVNSTNLGSVGILKGSDTRAALYILQFFFLINLTAICIVCSSNVPVDYKTTWLLLEICNYVSSDANNQQFLCSVT